MSEMIKTGANTSGGSIPQWVEGDRLRKALEHAGLSNQGMADYLGVSRNTVSNYIHGRGKRGIDKRTRMLWAERCGVSYQWLLTGMATESRCNPQTSKWATSSVRAGLVGPS